MVSGEAKRPPRRPLRSVMRKINGVKVECGKHRGVTKVLLLLLRIGTADIIIQ